MLVDYINRSAPLNISADICIIGGGPAGISLAIELANAGKNIVLLEGGGTELEPQSQQLYKGDSIGQPYFPLSATRLRGLGGSTGHWSGWCGVLDDIDFQVRDWVRHSGWPISREELLPHYLKAQQYAQLSDRGFTSEDWESEYEKFPAFNQNNLVAKIWQLSVPPLNFGLAYKQQIESLGNVTLLTHANVKRLNLNESGKQIISADIAALNGRSGVATSNTFILACGGIENPRLLLASNNINPRGVGNDQDQVGRYFMDHLEAEAATITQFDGELIHSLKRLNTSIDQIISVAYCTSDTKQRALGIGNGAAFIAAPNLSKESGWTSLLNIRDDILRKKIPKNLVEQIGTIFRDFDTVAGVAALRVAGKSTSARIVSKGSVNVVSHSEQVPNPDSRITLSEERDLFGMPLASLNWQLTEQDKRTIRSTMQLIATEVSRLDLGRMQLHDWLSDDSPNKWPETLRGGHHHIGTTRMSDTPLSGVVDKNCKVHQVGNLYVAGSSVFPTGGYVSPTLSIVALSCRLADHLRTLF